MNISPKVAVSGAAGALSILILWIVQTIWPKLVIPPEVASSLTVILSTGAAYLTPHLSLWNKPSSGTGN